MLTQSDKRWLRDNIRRIVHEQLTQLGGELSDALNAMQAATLEQLGGYDGATPVDEREIFGDDRKRQRQRIGFTVERVTE